jgi:CheY-like chemotaxis protein
MDAVKVLVVDDEHNARLALCELLREEGYDVAWAGDGAEALKRVTTFRPEVVLSDVKMPGMSGLELREELAARAPAPVVVLMSAYPQYRPDGLFVSKPIALGELYRTLADASARARASV